MGRASHRTVGTEADPVQFALFNHLFISMAEQMGRMLQI